MPVVVVHGLWLNGLEFFLLRDRLRRRGFAPSIFRYHSMHASLGDAADALAARLRQLGGTVHVVAHSLGGLVASRPLLRHADLPPGRIVLLGSPVQRLARGAGGRRAGRSARRCWAPLAVAELARERERRWQLPREVGVIAGSRSVGLGRLFCGPARSRTTARSAWTRRALPGATRTARA